MTRFFLLNLWLILALIAVFSLEACGRKPEGLLQPDTAGLTSYPQVYPKPLPGETPPIGTGSEMAQKYTARPDQSLQ